MASNSAHTVLSILQLMSDLRGESATNTDASRIRAVSRAEKDFARRMLWRVFLVKDQSIGTGDGTTTSFTLGSATYPYRQKGFMELFVGGTSEDKRHSTVDFNRFKTLYNGNNAERMGYEWYDQANDAWKVKVNPAPSSGDAVTASWYYEPPTRTLTTDLVICPNPYVIAYMALADIYHAEDEDQKEIDARTMAEQLIDELKGAENSPAVGQTYSFGSIENSLRTRGIGSY